MIRALTLHASEEPAGGALFLELAIALREHRVHPRSLEWTASDTGEVSLALASRAAAGGFGQLAERLRGLDGVRSVEVRERGTGRRTAGRAEEPVSGQHFTD